MSLHPVLLDDRPRFLGGARSAASVLQLPTPAGGSVLTALATELGVLTPVRPLVLSRVPCTPTYRSALRATGVAPDIVDSSRALLERLETLDLADEVLLIDASLLPLGLAGWRALTRLAAPGAGMARHLVVLGEAAGSTHEYAQLEPDGRLRRIRRCYVPKTWLFPDAIIASAVPVGCLLAIGSPELDCLPGLRRAIALQGAPSQDIPVSGAILHLSEETGVLRLTEGFVRARTSSRERLHASVVAPSCRIAPSARLVGPVVLERGVVVEEEAVIVGPSLVCEGARVGRGSVVAQALVMPDTRVPEGRVLRHRVAAETAWPLSAETGGDGGTSTRGQPTGLLEAPTAMSGARGYPAIKRVVESAVAAVGLAMLSPLLAVIGMAIKLSSPGPVLFGHEREGWRGRPFRCWKFRTMRVGADALQRELAGHQALDGPQFKLEHDPRVTPIGRLLRATNLDELPQFWNVLTGQMSFVGPRPSPFRENQICVPWRRGRLSVRPGITGLWQICRRDRGAGDFHQWIEYDLLYVTNMSARLDLRIFVATLLTLGGRRAVPLRRLLPRLARTGGETADSGRTAPASLAPVVAWP